MKIDFGDELWGWESKMRRKPSDSEMLNDHECNQCGELQARVEELEHICNEKNKILDYLHEEGDKLRARVGELEAI